MRANARKSCSLVCSNARKSSQLADSVFSISERELEHDHGDDGDVDGDVDAVPNKLDHADDEDDECHVVRVRDVDDGHDGDDDRS